ncbi:hypothetical protein STEG23_008458, partial [Scotinomys teguina]
KVAIFWEVVETKGTELEEVDQSSGSFVFTFDGHDSITLGYSSSFVFTFDGNADSSVNFVTLTSVTESWREKTLTPSSELSVGELLC